MVHTGKEGTLREELESQGQWLGRFKAQPGDARLQREPFLTSGKTSPPVLPSSVHVASQANSLFLRCSDAKTDFCCLEGASEKPEMGPIIQGFQCHPPHAPTTQATLLGFPVWKN